MNINSATKLIGLIGNPVEHSVSPTIHNELCSVYNKNLAYLCFKVEPEQLQTAIKGLYSLGIVGFNVTVPYKENVAKLMDYLDETADIIGSVNTVSVEDGKLIGYNTDCHGFGKSLLQSNVNVYGKDICVIGAGGVSRAIVYQLIKMGAESIHIFNRSIEKAQRLSTYMNNKFQEEKCLFFSLNELEQIGNRTNYAMFINCTSLGMHPRVNETPINPNLLFGSNTVFYDTIYNPAITEFLKMGKSRGCKIINGLDMLLWQGAYAYQKWTGIMPTQEDIDSIKSKISL